MIKYFKHTLYLHTYKIKINHQFIIFEKYNNSAETFILQILVHCKYLLIKYKRYLKNTRIL